MNGKYAHTMGMPFISIPTGDPLNFQPLWQRYTPNLKFLAMRLQPVLGIKTQTSTTHHQQ